MILFETDLTGIDKILNRKLKELRNLKLQSVCIYFQLDFIYLAGSC